MSNVKHKQVYQCTGVYVVISIRGAPLHDFETVSTDTGNTEIILKGFSLTGNILELLIRYLKHFYT